MPNGEKVNIGLVFGLAAFVLGIGYLLTQKKGKGQVQELADVLQERDPKLSDAEALALAAAQIAQESVNRAQNASDPAGVGVITTVYTDAEGNNEVAQVIASTNPTDTKAQEDAAAAAAAAAAARTQLEASYEAQLREVEAACASAKGALQTAVGAYGTVRQAYLDYVAYVDARMANKSMNCGALWKDSNQSGSALSFKQGDTSLKGTGMNNEASSYTLYKGFKLTLFKNSDMTGGAFGPVYGTGDTNVGNLSGYNDCAGGVRCEPYKNAYNTAIADKLAAADRVKLEVTNCQTALNSCIERAQSLIDLIRTYNVLSARISTVGSSLIALRSYVASIRV